MIRIGKKILEGLILAGVIIGFGVIFLFEALDLFLVRPIYQRFFKTQKSDFYKSDNSKGWVLDMPDKPFNSWIWNKDAQRYEAPIDEPSDSINSGQTVENGKTYKWDEDLYQSDNTNGWVEIT